MLLELSRAQRLPIEPLFQLLRSAAPEGFLGQVGMATLANDILFSPICVLRHVRPPSGDPDGDGHCDGLTRVRCLLGDWDDVDRFVSVMGW